MPVPWLWQVSGAGEAVQRRGGSEGGSEGGRTEGQRGRAWKAGDALCEQTWG